MALMETVRQLMKGRSDAVERGVDAAVHRFGRYGETLKRQAETIKAQARGLDADRGGTPGPAATADDAVPPPAPAPAEPTAADGPSLKGDLVDDDPPGGHLPS